MVKEGRSSGGSASRNRFRGALVIAEVALTLVLLVCAGLLIRTVVRLRGVDVGFNTDNILTMNIGLPAAKYPKPENVVAFFKEADERIAALPGVKAAGITSVLPLSDNFDGRGLVVEDYPRPAGDEISVDLYVVTPGYLKAMSIHFGKAEPSRITTRTNPRKLLSSIREWPMSCGPIRIRLDVESSFPVANVIPNPGARSLA